MYVVCVTLDVKPDLMDSFLPLMARQAENSLSREEACRQFDVCRSVSRHNRVLLYEAYDDEAAFQMHLSTDHFREFDTAVSEMIDWKVVETYERMG